MALISIFRFLRFICSNYNVGATDTIKRNSCVLDKSSSLNCPKTPVTTQKTTLRPGPPTRKSSGSVSTKPLLSSDSENVILKGFEVQVGKDGTKDRVTAKVRLKTYDYNTSQNIFHL